MHLTSDDLLSSPDERSQELGTVAAIYPELQLTSPTSATISVPISPILPVPVSFNSTETFFPISHFPPLTLTFNLPESYPESSPPEIDLSTFPAWIPRKTIRRLKSEIDCLWDDFGRGQVVFTAIDHVQQSAEKAFDLVSPTTWLMLPADLKTLILDFNSHTKKSVFERGTYECGICLEPKKGTQCHRLRSCTHVFCRPCLTDYFSTMIKEGRVSSVVCSDPICVKKAKTALSAAPQTPPGTPPATSSTHKVMLPPTLPPDELREIPIEKSLVKRYIELKQKAALEKDPETVYCPRQWCQAPSRESIIALNRAMAANHTSYYLTDVNAIITALPVTASAPPPDPPKLHICSRCTFAFCRICVSGWHGDRVICRSKDAPLSPEELANEEYLRSNTTACPQCSAPVLKSHGCNHMICKCLTHFCFLCSAYLPPNEPYKHFNTKGFCYQKLWVGEEGDGEDERLPNGLVPEEVLQEQEERVRERERVRDAERRREEGRRREERERERERDNLPFVVGVAVPPRVEQRGVAQAPRVRVRGRFADWGETDDEDTEGEEHGMDFDDVPDV